MARTKSTATASTRKVTADSGGTPFVEATVADEYKGYSSLMVGGVELSITDGKVNVSKELVAYLKAQGYTK